MHSPRFLRRAFVALASFVFFAALALALDPSKPPSGNFDLTHWKLTLPTGTSGNPDEILPAQLSAGYTNSPYFVTASDGAMRFWCPVTGVTTGGSSYPRCELREQISPGNDTPNWYGDGTHTLTAQVVVRQVASTGKVIIGQIHGKTAPDGSDANPLVKLDYNSSDNSVHVQIKDSPYSSNSAEQSTTVGAGALTIGATINYTIQVVNGVATVTINNYTPVSRNFYASDPAWQQTDLYFKAGDYCQDNSGTSSEGAMIDFYSLSASHGTPPNITTTSLPGGRTTISYGNQQLAASGGTTPYTWSLASGTLPAGLSLSSGGVISGTPTTAGTSNFTAQVTDAASQTDTQALSITINTNSLPSITTTSLPGATTGVAYNQTVSSTGGDGALLWSVQSGALPAGISLSNMNNQNSTLSGTPTTAGTSNFTLKLVDVDNDTATQALSIVVSAPAQVVAPSFSPGGGTYTSAQSVTISTTTSGASIRYTTDGSTPTSTSGTVYSTPVNIAATTTLKAIAYKSGMTDSTVTSASYTINTGGGSVVATAGGAWQNSTMAAQSGTFTTTFDATPSASPNNAIVALSLGAQTTFTGFACLVRFNTTGTIDVRNAGTYSAAATVAFSANSTYHFRLVANISAHTYSVYVTPPGGSETTLASSYAFRTEQNTVASLDHWGVFVDTTANGGAGTLTVSNFVASVAAPTFSPGGGTYSGAQNVTIASTTGGVSIRYTTDGSTPTSTNGTLYTAAVNIAATATLKAIAYETGLTDSSVTSATYTINAGGGNTVPVILEAESVSFDSNWQNISDANAYGGHALQALTNSTSSAPANGGLVYSFTLNASSTIYIQTRSRSPNGGSSDSFWLRLDGGSWAQFVQGGTNTYTWSNKSFSSVASGAHTFEIRYREAQAVLDEVAVTLNSNPPN